MQYPCKVPVLFCRPTQVTIKLNIHFTHSLLSHITVHISWPNIILGILPLIQCGLVYFTSCPLLAPHWQPALTCLWLILLRGTAPLAGPLLICVTRQMALDLNTWLRCKWETQEGVGKSNWVQVAQWQKPIWGHTIKSPSAVWFCLCNTPSDLRQ